MGGSDSGLPVSAVGNLQGSERVSVGRGLYSRCQTFVGAQIDPSTCYPTMLLEPFCCQEYVPNGRGSTGQRLGSVESFDLEDAAVLQAASAWSLDRPSYLSVCLSRSLSLYLSLSLNIYIYIYMCLSTYPRHLSLNLSWFWWALFSGRS